MSRGAAPRAARYRKAFAIIFLDFNMLGKRNIASDRGVKLVDFAAAHGVAACYRYCSDRKYRAPLPNALCAGAPAR